MFTGLVEEVGVVARIAGARPVVRIAVDAPFAAPLALGESIAVEGACLTVARITERGFEADVSSETLD